MYPSFTVGILLFVAIFNEKSAAVDHLCIHPHGPQACLHACQVTASARNPVNPKPNGCCDQAGDCYCCAHHGACWHHNMKSHCNTCERIRIESSCSTCSPPVPLMNSPQNLPPFVQRTQGFPVPRQVQGRSPQYIQGPPSQSIHQVNFQQPHNAQQYNVPQQIQRHPVTQQILEPSFTQRIYEPPPQQGFQNSPHMQPRQQLPPPEPIREPPPQQQNQEFSSPQQTQEQAFAQSFQEDLHPEHLHSQHNTEVLSPQNTDAPTLPGQDSLYYQTPEKTFYNEPYNSVPESHK